MPTSCPSPQNLEQMLTGPAGPAETDRLASHLEQCERCAAVVDGVLDRSGLMALVKSHARSAVAPGPQVEQLIGRIRALKTADAHHTPSPAQADVSTSQSAVADRGQTRPQSASHLNRLGLEFLDPPSAPDELGWLAQYRILKPLGAGGMGVVLLAEDTQLQRQVALKVMQPTLAADRASRDRFLREARAAAALTHDHVVTIHQVGEANGAPFLAMQLLQGKSLDAYLAGGKKLSAGQVCRIGREAALGLAAAHTKGLIHRDIKPANLWLEAPKGRVKILDFGLARPADDAHLTGTGMALGTPAYMAPEQARGLSLDGRCDLWSLGVVLYRLCADRLPFRGGDMLSIFTAIAVDEPARLASLNPEVPPALAELVHQLLAKDREKRPATAQEVADRLLAIERSLAKATPTARTENPELERPSPAPTAASPPRKRRTFAVALAGGLLPVLVFAGWIIIKIQHKDGTTSEHKVPDDAKVTVEVENERRRADATPVKPREQAPLRPAGAVIDLLALVDPAKDAVNGQWERRGTDLVQTDPGIDNPGFGVLELPYRPPAEYDFTIEFTRRNGSSVGQHLALSNGRMVQWLMSYGPEPQHSFECADGNPLRKSTLPTTAHPKLERGHRYTARVEVRRDALHAFIGETAVAEFRGEFARLFVPAHLRPRDSGTLALTALRGVEFHKVEVTEVTGRGTLTRPSPSPAPIDLLALVDPATDARNGTWERQGASIVGTGRGPDSKMTFAVLELPYRPPAEYDFVVEFSKRDVGGVVQYLALPGGRQGMWTMAFNKLRGFELVDGGNVADPRNPTVVTVPPMPVKQRFAARVEVRADGLRALIDGKPIAEFRGDTARLGAPAFMRPRDPSLLALTLFGGPVEIYKIEVTEVTGRGTVTRPAAAAPALSFPPLDEVWVNTVQPLPLNAQVKEVAAELKRRNPGFDGQVRHVPLKEGPSLEMTSDDIVDLTALRAISGLAGLKVQGSEPRTGKLTDLSPLAGLKLLRLHVTNCKVRDLTPLKGMPINALLVTGTEVRDLSALRGLEHLESLGLHHNLQLTDLAPLADTRLKHINLNPSPARLPGLRAIKTLETINNRPVAEFWKEHDVPPPGGKGP